MRVVDVTIMRMEKKSMPNYRVGFSTGAWSSIVVEAETELEAKEKAQEVFEKVEPRLCHQCSGGWQDQGANLELGEEWEMSDDVDTTESEPTEIPEY